MNLFDHAGILSYLDNQGARRCTGVLLRGVLDVTLEQWHDAVWEAYASLPDHGLDPDLHIQGRMPTTTSEGAMVVTEQAIALIADAIGPGNEAAARITEYTPGTALEADSRQQPDVTARLSEDPDDFFVGRLRECLTGAAVLGVARRG